MIIKKQSRKTSEFRDTKNFGISELLDTLAAGYQRFRTSEQQGIRVSGHQIFRKF